MATRAGFDISGIIQNAFHLFKGKFSHVCLGPCDGLVLKMHYRWAFYFTIGSFMTVWYFGKVIHCVSDFKGDVEARPDYTNICLSYPYILDDSKKKRYLLFYRWIHWSFLFIAAIYYIPRKVSKSFENQKSKKLFEDLATLSSRYDQSEKELIQRSAFLYDC
ncbi:hypothetical protein Avbf_18245 [Armadillidium vulgare]|nr:hypothetical protein Avbf_09163 [Armadillidium vulgare]RXG60345.1 hypothetical protein Avbf_18245 [Armadillidium vulgare]